jgi:hypothetical protein
MIAMLDVLVVVDGTVVVFSGTDAADGRPVVVAVDRRYGADIAAMIEDGDPVPCFVEPWQVLGRGVELRP